MNLILKKQLRDNHAKVFKQLDQSIKKDYTLIATAFAQAQKAVDYFVSSK